MHETLCQATSERDIFAPGFDSAAVGSKETRRRIDGERQNHGVESKRQDPVQ